MEKKWLLKPAPLADLIAGLASALGGEKQSVLAALLLQRGISTFDEAKAFFNPDAAALHDPFLMKDMDKATARLNAALQGGEKILVYGDYDVDGTTAVSLVYAVLRMQYSALSYYIPDRYSEGYGISMQSIDYAAENGFSLIIALDCGIKSVAHIDYATQKGIDYIIADHHLPGDTLPAAAAVLDAKQSGCPYPFKELSGCGVGYKLMQALYLSQGRNTDELLPFTDLLVISIAADIVPVTGENRIFCAIGLQHLNRNPRPGIAALMEISGFRNVVFGLAPRINAAGRMEHGKTAVALLLSESREEAVDIAFKINENNNDRRISDTDITEQALAQIAENPALANARSTVLYHPDWNKGVIGIVASRCIERYYRPTIILTKAGDYAAGSARSVAGFDLYEAITECADLLIQYGGHTHAAGLTLKIENIPAFRERFEAVAQSRITPEQTIPVISVDLPLNFSEITDSFCRNLQRMAPFGPQNMQPVFSTEGVTDTGQSRVLKAKNEGAEGHLRLMLQQEGNPEPLEAMAFGMAERYIQVSSRKQFSICYTIDYQLWNGRYYKKLMIKDMTF